MGCMGVVELVIPTTEEGPHQNVKRSIRRENGGVRHVPPSVGICISAVGAEAQRKGTGLFTYII